jgi:AcrR family transcriptional regulator
MAQRHDQVKDGRQVRWQRHNQRRRQKILDSALAVLAEHEPGEEIHVQEIADRAGLSRTVVYRHFEDRSDLDLAVQQEICRRVGDAVTPAIAYHGAPTEMLRRIVDAYVRWAVDNQAQMRFVEQDLPGVAVKPMEMALRQIAEQVEELMNGVVAALGAELADEDRATLVPWVFSLVGGCFYAVRCWSQRALLEPDVTVFIDLMTESMWYQIDGLARARGIELPTGAVEQLLAEMETNEDTA